LLIAGDGRRSVYDKKPQRYAKDNRTESNCTNKAEVSNNKDCARGTVLLKLTTDKNEASRGLSPTAQLPVA